MIGRIASLGVLMALAMAGCDAGPPAAEEPVWGKQPCSHCAMLLSDRLHGAQVVTQQGDRHFFDDLGCMVAWDAQNQGQAKARWVRQFDQAPTGKGWLPAEQATFVRALHTPMDFGFVAVAKPVTAQPPRLAVAWPEVVVAVHSKLGGR